MLTCAGHIYRMFYPEVCSFLEQKYVVEANVQAIRPKDAAGCEQEVLQ